MRVNPRPVATLWMDLLYAWKNSSQLAVSSHSFSRNSKLLRVGKNELDSSWTVIIGDVFY